MVVYQVIISWQTFIYHVHCFLHDTCTLTKATQPCIIACWHSTKQQSYNVKRIFIELPLLHDPWLAQTFQSTKSLQVLHIYHVKMDKCYKPIHIAIIYIYIILIRYRPRKKLYIHVNITLQEHNQQDIISIALELV